MDWDVGALAIPTADETSKSVVPTEIPAIRNFLTAGPRSLEFLEEV
jgi:hypothetical protein